MAHSYPTELAAFVRRQWSEGSELVEEYCEITGERDALPPDRELETILSTCYQASLLREEERPVRFRLMLRGHECFPQEGGPPHGLHRLLFSETRDFTEHELRRLAPALETFERGTSWRCMDGALYACNVGANLPCDEKPAADPAVSDAMRSFCAESPGSDVIPMYVTGHATIYDWSCDGKEPRRGRRIAELDPRGYVASIWHRISAPQPSPSPPRTR